MSDLSSRKDARCLAVELAQILKERKMSDAELSRASKINSAQISRIKGGIQIWSAPEDIYAIAQACCKSKSPEDLRQIHGRLVYARLQDELNQQVGPGPQIISIEIKTNQAATLHEKPAPYKTPLPPAIQADLTAIEGAVMKNRDVRYLVKSLARVARGTRLPQARPK